MHTLLIAHPDQTAREFLSAQLDADGHTIHQADSATAITAKLAAYAIDVLILSDLARPADAPALLRSLRAGRLHTRIHPAQPVITLGDTDQLSTLRAYHAGSDHHLPADSEYLILRAVIDTITRRTLDEVTSRHIHVDALHINTAARTADINDTRLHLGLKEFEVLVTLAGDPTKVFSKDELARRVWGQHTPLASSRTVECHVTRLRRHLHDAGAPLIHNRRGAGWSLHNPR